MKKNMKIKRPYQKMRHICETNNSDMLGKYK